MPMMLSMNFAAGHRGMLVSVSLYADYLQTARNTPPLIGNAQTVSVTQRIKEITLDQANRFFLANAELQDIHLRIDLRHHARLVADNIGAVGFFCRSILFPNYDRYSRLHAQPDSV